MGTERTGGRSGLWVGLVALVSLAVGLVVVLSQGDSPSVEAATEQARSAAAPAQANEPREPRELSAEPGLAAGRRETPRLSPLGADGGTARLPEDEQAERRADHMARRELRMQKREQWRERRRMRREQKEARILESVADDPEAQAHWEARFEERRRKREAAEWRHSEEGREARRQRAQEHAARAQKRGPPPPLPSEEGAVIGGPSAQAE